MSALRDPLNIVGSKTNKVTARFENTNLGVCPVCGEKMKVLLSVDIPTYTCIKDCVAFPKENTGNV